MAEEPTPLAQRLREVAHLADVQAHNRAILRVIGKSMSRDEKRTVVSWVRSTAVTIAVLRELANDVEWGSSGFLAGGPAHRAITHHSIRGLADSIEKGGADD